MKIKYYHEDGRVWREVDGFDSLKVSRVGLGRNRIALLKIDGEMPRECGEIEASSWYLVKESSGSSSGVIFCSILLVFCIGIIVGAKLASGG